MTPEVIAVVPISKPTTASEPAAATLQTIEERARAIAEVDQRMERFSLYALEAYMLPRLHWHGGLRGRA